MTHLVELGGCGALIEHVDNIYKAMCGRDDEGGGTAGVYVDKCRPGKEWNGRERTKHAQVVYLDKLVSDGAGLAEAPSDRIHKVAGRVETLHTAEVCLD